MKGQIYMKQYKELNFYGTTENFNSLIENIASNLPHKWSYEKITNITTFYYFDYTGRMVDSARVSIYYSNENSCFRVGNITPIEKNDLTVDEYNTVLDFFYDSVISSHVDNPYGILIEGPTSDIFDPTMHMSELALRKLCSFCNCANKSTGASHPCDQERWYDFICQTIDDERIVDTETLFKFLQDEEYWGSNTSTVIGSSAWSEEKAGELALQYEQACSVLLYYKENY